MQASEFQRHRQTFTQQLRKKNREQIFSKKRNLNTIDETTNNQQLNSMQQQKNQKKIIIVDEQRKDIIMKFIQCKYTIDQFHELKANVFDPNIQVKHRGVIGIRKIISVDNNPPIQEVIDAQLVPIFIQMAKQSVYPQLQLEATWILTNICSGTTQQCQSVIVKGGVPIFVQLLIQNKPGIVDQAVWAIGNLSGDCVQYRDMILKTGALDQLIKIANSSKDKMMIRQLSWTISNLCRGSPIPKYDLIKNGIICLCHIVKNDMLDRQNLIDSLWAISFACEGQKSKIQKIVQTGVVKQLIKICDTTFIDLLTPTLRILGNISTGNQVQTQQLLSNGILQLFNKLIQHQKKTIRRQICWILSNITAGTKTQINQFLKMTLLVDKVLRLFQMDVNQVKRQICYIFSNMANLGDKNTVYALYLQKNMIEYYARLLIDAHDNKTIQIVLDTLYAFLSVGEKMRQTQKSPNVLLNQLIAIPAVADTLQKLQYNQSKVIYAKTVKILQKYFDLEQDLTF